MVRRLAVVKAQEKLEFTANRAAEMLLAVVNQAVANATNNMKLPLESLRFAAIEIDEGPKYKRWQAVSRGRAHPIIKRTCHVKVVLEGEPLKQVKEK